MQSRPVSDRDKRRPRTGRAAAAREKDGVGFVIVTIAGQCQRSEKGDEWHEQFRQWYKPHQWIGSHRAAAVFLGMKLRTRGAFPTTEEPR